MPNHLGLLLHGLNKDFARLVINEGDKVEEILVRMGGEDHTVRPVYALVSEMSHVTCDCHF